MSRRLFPTLADYVIVAINPALVMTLVGSLVYFLLELLYQGNYPERLHFSLTMFVFAIVLVSRIAMEEGFEHAAPFGMALAVVVWLAMQRFVDYGHGALGHFGWLLNGGLMALSWWCAHKLTWDSTVIDESEESEGQGLLETVGIDRASGEVRAAEQSTAKETAAAKAQQAAGEPDAPRPKKGKRFRWEDLLNRKDRPHAPGVWIVYFSLAALPIFGIGQAFIPAVNTASRRYAFLLFVVYVASGLGLLLTTSFLALRRYLRQRHLEMPTRMVGTWLTTGVVMIVALLAIVALLPRPNAEFAVSQLPWPESKEDDEDDQPPDEAEKSTEDDQPKSSSVSAGQEGTRDKEATTGGGADHSPDAKSDQNSQGGAGPQPGGQAEASGRQQNRTGDQDDAGTKKGDPSSQGGKSGDESKQSGGDGKQSSNDKGGGSADQKSDSAGDQKSASNADSKESKDAQGKDGKAEPKPPDGAKSEQAKTKAEKEKAKAKPDSASGAKGAQPAKAKPPTSGPSQTPAPSPLSLGFLGDLLKWAFYLALIVGGAYLAWAHWEHVRSFLQHWLAEWRNFWDQILGRSRKPVASSRPDPLVFAPPPRSFSEYSDPFAMGKPRGWSNADLVKYTFAALEAWSHDHGYDRRPEETPHEFARQLGSQTPLLAAGARSLVDEYSRIVYGPGATPQFNTEQLRRFWQTLRSLPAQSISAGAEV